MKINWKVRFKNPQFIIQMLLAVIIPIGSYFGITGSEITSWKILWNLILNALSNPYVILMVVISVYNAVTDPTTKGLTDSLEALKYKKPKQ